MKKQTISLLLLFASSVLAQATTTRSSQEENGVRRFTLQQLKDSALQHNNAVRAARLDIAAAEQQRKEAFTKYFPNVSATGLWFNANRGMAKTDINMSEYITPEMGASLAQSLGPGIVAAMASPVTVSMMKNGTVGSVTATQPVFAGGQIINGNKLAKVGEEASQLQLQLSENEVEKTTEQYYWQLVSLQEKMKTIDAVDTMLSDIYKDVDVAVRAGVAMRNDLLQVQLRQNDVASQRLKLQNGISIVKLLLGQFIGLTPSLTPDPSPNGEERSLTPSPSPNGEGSIYLFDIEVPDINLQEYILPSPFGEGLGVRPELGVKLLPEYQLLTKQVEAADLQRKMEKGKNLPSLAVGAGYTYHNMLDRDHTFGMIFATVSVPISDWWGGSHALKRRKIEHQKAVEQLEDNTQLLQIRMQNAWNGVEESYQQLLLSQRSIEQAKENLRLNRDYYRAGTSKMSDLLEAQLLYQQALDRRTDAFADHQNKLLEYRQASGQ